MLSKQRRILLMILMALGSGGALFNLFQIIIIINGNYNRNPDIDSKLLQTLDAIGLTLLWLLVSVVITLVAWSGLRQKNR